MAWTKVVDVPGVDIPVVHPPDRCMHCGHPKDQHVPEVGCITEGGVKRLVDDQGNTMSACACEQYLPAVAG